MEKEKEKAAVSDGNEQPGIECEKQISQKETPIPSGTINGSENVRSDTNLPSTSGSKPSSNQIQPRKTRKPPKKPKISCKKSGCETPDNNEMVECDSCKKWFHYTCVGVDATVADRPWSCVKCESKMERDSQRSIRRIELEEKIMLEQKRLKDKRAEDERLMKEKRLEEERLEKERIDQEYLTQRQQIDEDFINSKLELLSTSSSSRASSKSSSVISSKKRTERWLMDQHASNSKIKHNENEKIKSAPISSTPANRVTVYNDNPRTARERFPRAPHIGNEHRVNSNTFVIPELNLSSNNFAARQVLGKIDLPTFSGNSLDWPMFISAFTQTTEQCCYSNSENLLRLQKALKGEALDLVRSSLIYADAVPSVIESLRQMFGQPETIMARMVKRIRTLPVVKPERFDMLIKFSIETKNLYATMVASQLLEHLNNPMLRQELVDKLPHNLKLDWGFYRRSRGSATLEEFVHWLADVAEAASMSTPDINFSEKKTPEVKETSSKPKGASKKFDYQLTAVHEVKSVVEDNSLSCVVCKSGGHAIEDCGEFLKLAPGKRIDLTIKHSLCRTCLKQHNSYCSVKKRCEVDGCKRFHHALLHKLKTREDTAPQQSKSTNNQHPETKDTAVQSGTQYNHQASSQTILYRILPVFLSSPTRRVKTFAMFDEGSSTTLVEESIAQHLELDGPKIELHLKWTGDIFRVEENSRMVSASISGIQIEDQQYQMRNIRTVEKLDLPAQAINSNDLAKYPHLNGFSMPSYAEGRPTIIIGLDQYKLGLPLEIREGNDDNAPIATRTRLGWTICGPIKKMTNNHRINTHRCECDQDLHDNVKQFFTLENFGIIPKKFLENKETERARSIMAESTKFENGRYVTALLWNLDNVILPASRDVAL